jgi:hypothetical protein
MWATQVLYSLGMETAWALVQIIRLGVGSNYRPNGCHMASTMYQTVLKWKGPEFFVSVYGLDISFLCVFKIPELIVMP